MYEFLYEFSYTITSSTMKATPESLVSFLNPRKKSPDPWLSPPSPWIGSMISPATGIPFFSYSLIKLWISARHFRSTSWFSFTFSSRGYLYLGYVAIGQSNAGTSSLEVVKEGHSWICSKNEHAYLWIGLEWVQLRAPKVLPWKPPLNDMMESFGAPGDWFHRLDSISSSVGASPLRSRFLYQKQAAFIAFSTAQDPHAMVWTLDIPQGATDIRADCSFSTKSLGGRIPRAGLFTNVLKFLGSLATARRAGWLYPRGMEEIWEYTSRKTFPSTSHRKFPDEMKHF